MSIYLFNLNKVEIYHRGVYSDSLLLISFIYLHVCFIKTKERMDYMYMYLDYLCNIKTVWSSYFKFVISTKHYRRYGINNICELLALSSLGR